MSVYLVNVTVHVLAAIVWLGGMLFLALVGAPVLRGIEPASLRARLFRELGLRFRTVGWLALGVLILTGLLNLQMRGLLAPDVLGSGSFWAGSYGRALAVKLGAVLVMLVVSVLHDFVVGPAASRAQRARGADPHRSRGASGARRLTERRS